MRLAAVDAAAAAIGLSAGMALADARARLPDLETLPHDPAADARALARLVTAAARFTPLAMADPPDGLILDITGCAHLFGGEAALARAVVAQCPYTARHALAGNAAAARALARYGAGSGEVSALPVAALEPGETMLVALRRAGLTRLGDLAARPLAALAARFGEDVVMRLRQILGDADSPMAPRPPRPRLRCEARFAEPIARTDDVLEVIEALLGEAAAVLARAGEGGRRFTVTLYRSDGAECALAVETGQPARDPAPVLRLFRERIDTLADPLDPGYGFDAVALVITRRQPLAARQVDLENGKAAPSDGFQALVDRLAVRLGPESVRALHPCDRHVPEGVQGFGPVGGSMASGWRPPPERPPRPLYLFDPPQRVTAIAAVPDGPPQRFRWRGHLHEVRLAEGPERIAGEWWRWRRGHLPLPWPAGGGGLTRDYYRVEDAEGRRYWMFRHGGYGETPDPGWYVHGLFA